MNEAIKPGLTHRLEYHVPSNKTVPHLFPEFSDFEHMPQVFATGFMVGLVEYACMLAIKPYLDWPGELTVGTRLNLTHSAPTPPGLTITVDVALIEIDRRRLVFNVSASDGIDIICEGTHERFVIDMDRFNANLARKIT